MVVRSSDIHSLVHLVPLRSDWTHKPGTIPVVAPISVQQLTVSIGFLWQLRSHFMSMNSL